MVGLASQLSNILSWVPQGTIFGSILFFVLHPNNVTSRELSYVYADDVLLYAKQKHLGCKKGEANQKQQLSDYESIHSYTCD